MPQAEFDIDEELEAMRRQKGKPAASKPEVDTSAAEFDIEEELKAMRQEKGKPAEKRSKVETSAAEFDIQAELEAMRKASEAVVEEKDVVGDEPRIYVVQRGDNLSKIAQEVYGKASRWREIYEANKDRIENPNLIRPGWKLRIP
jgi:nucleoid-associated protein YgaU